MSWGLNSDPFFNDHVSENALTKLSETLQFVEMWRLTRAAREFFFVMKNVVVEPNIFRQNELCVGLVSKNPYRAVRQTTNFSVGC